uniref:GH16 domain-containing protein n=1 Tax=Mycena chlorophos TaxID=658473 RepID=A0ABQ0M3P8_MYCCL|nr:predicted protein [Mycena chlorophos]
MAQRRSRGYYSVGNSSAAELSPDQSNNPFRSPTQSQSSLNLVDDNRRGSSSGTISDKFHLSADPADWGADISRSEPDDALHNPDPRAGKNGAGNGSIFTRRGFWNIGCLVLMAVIIIGVFLGYPVASHFTSKSSQSALASGTSSSSAKDLPNITNWNIIDVATPADAYTIPSFNDPSKTLSLVFSDEFEVEGRSFYPGDDPYWEAVDLHYWSTGDLEWYDPVAVTTRAGALEINLTQVEDITLNHNLSYRSGMLSTWNKFCFTGGLVLAKDETSSDNRFGLWPAIWTMGNLGRAGYGASLDGMWPYSYDVCDVGTLPNQTMPDGVTPAAALDTGASGTELSYLPGQRLSRCTCPGESHPGPIHSEDGSFVGRSAPEIDMFEAQMVGPLGAVSQSSQWAPFDAYYSWQNTSANLIIPNTTISAQNGYAGGIYQEAASVVTITNQDCYQLKTPCYATHGFEYTPGYNDAYITWITNDAASWTLHAAGVGPNNLTQIGAREITQEPLYILINLGLSHNFVWDIDFADMSWPATMRVDWIRVYQDPNNVNQTVGCETPERPTQAYINTYIEAYTNPNLTTWVDDYKQVIPKNSLSANGCN